MKGQVSSPQDTDISAGHVASSLIFAMLDAPLIGIGPNRRVLHAVPMEHVYDAYNTGAATAECGAQGLKLMAQNGAPVPWPPRAAGLPADLHRCGDCLAASQPKRPRVRFEP